MSKSDSRYSKCQTWIDKAQDAQHRAVIAASASAEVSDDWLDDCDEDYAAEGSEE